MKTILYLDSARDHFELFRRLAASLPFPTFVITLPAHASAVDVIAYNKVDLIVTQIYPEGLIDGKKLISFIRSGMYGEENKNIPAIAHTTIVLVGTEKECLDIGFNAYVPMPDLEKKLKKEIERLLAAPFPESLPEGLFH